MSRINTSSPSGIPPKALIVEADVSLRAVLVEALRLDGMWLVVEASIEAEALEAVERHRPAVVVWAATPDGEAPEGLLRLLETYHEHQIPCVILATAGRGHLAIESEGIAGFIDASFDLAALGAEVARLIGLA